MKILMIIIYMKIVIYNYDCVNNNHICGETIFNLNSINKYGRCTTDNFVHDC